MSVRDIFKTKHWGTLRFNVPSKMQYSTKTGKQNEAPPITKTGAISTRNGEKAIKLNLVNDEEKDPQIEKLLSDLAKLKKGLDSDGQRVINTYIKRFEDDKTATAEKIEVILGKFKRDIDKGRWSLKYGDKVNTGILNGRKDKNVLAIFNQTIDHRSKK